MKIRMLETTPVSTTGVNKLIWEKGKVYDASEDLAVNLVKGELAELKPGTKLPETPEDVEPVLETPEDDESAPEIPEDINGDDSIDLDKIL